MMSVQHTYTKVGSRSKFPIKKVTYIQYSKTKKKKKWSKSSLKFGQLLSEIWSLHETLKDLHHSQYNYVASFQATDSTMAPLICEVGLSGLSLSQSYLTPKHLSHLILNFIITVCWFIWRTFFTNFASKFCSNQD